MFYKGFLSKWHFYLGLGWGKFITMCLLFIIMYFVLLGLPIPIVAIAAGIANKHYGSEKGLVHHINVVEGKVELGLQLYFIAFTKH